MMIAVAIFFMVATVLCSVGKLYYRDRSFNGLILIFGTVTVVTWLIVVTQ
jgi:hypothetical protein